MDPGDVEPVPDCTDLYYVDLGLYDTAGYGSVYVVDADRPAVVDTGLGTNREYLTDALDDLGVRPAAVLLTHVHLDHAGGAGFLADEFPDAEVYVHEAGAPHLVDPEQLVEGTKSAVGDQWRHYVEPKPIPEDRVERLADGDSVDLGDRTVDVHAAPGHAPHQVVYHDRGDDVVFTGDAAGLYVPKYDLIHQTSPPARFDLHGCNEDVDTIRELDPRVLCFGHFGPRAFDDDLLAGYKRTLVEWVEAVRRKRAELDDDGAVLDHFAANAPERLVDVWGEKKAREEERLNTRGVLTYLDYLDRREE